MIKHHVHKEISGLNGSDSLVSVVGLIISKADDSFIIDDGTGQLVIFMKPPENKEFVKVFGELISTDSDFQLQGTALQDLSKIDKLLYKKINSLVKR